MQSATFRGIAASKASHHVNITTSDHDIQPDMSLNSDRLMEKLATTASSRDEDDMKGSDSWRLHSDASTMSSRVTTPDPQPPRSRPPLSSSTTETQTPHVSRTPAIPIPGAVPPPPRPPRHPYPRYLQHIHQPRKFPEFPSHLIPGPIHNSNGHTPVLPQSFHSADGFRLDSRPPAPSPNAFPLRLLPPAEPLTSTHRTTSLPVMHRGAQTESDCDVDGLLQSDTLPSIGTSNGSSVQPRAPRFWDQVLTKSLTFVPSSENLSDRSWSSGYSSEEDTFAYRNARQFPPQLPAQHGTNLSTRRGRSSATNRITNWVSEYENSHSPARFRTQETVTPEVSDQSESEATASQLSGVSSHAEVEQLWQQLKQKRAKLHDIREHMAQTRQDLRVLRSRKDDSDNAFMKVIRPLLVSQRSDTFSSSLKLLDNRMDAMLKLREEYHYREASYETLELALDEEEKELSGLETKFFSLLAAGHDRDAEPSVPIRKNTTETTSSVDTETPYYLLGISADKPLEDVHPLYQDFATAVGELENAKEEYDDLIFVNSQYEEDRELREDTGRGINPEAEEFFAELPGEKSRMQDTIGKLEDEVARLRRLCDEKGVMKKFLSIHMSYILDPDKTYEDMALDDTRDILAKQKIMAHPRYSELLAQQSHLLEGSEPLTAKQAQLAAARLPNDVPNRAVKQRIAAKEYAIETLVQSYNSDNKADLVNRWILQQLRQSPLNVLLLQTVFGSECGLKIRDLWRWQCDVLYYWWGDDTTAEKEGVQGNYVSEMSEYSARQGTPQPSRAASDGELHLKPKTKSPRHFKSSEMLRFI